MKKSLLTILLCATMVLSLASCASTTPTTGSAATEPPAGNQTDNPSETQAAEETAAPETPEQPAYDFGGLTLKIGYFNDSGAPDPEADALSEAFYNRIKFVEENYNCTVEFVNCSSPTHNKYVQTVLAGEPIVDIGYILSPMIPALAEGKIIQPLEAYSSYDVNAYKWRPDVTQLASYNGSYYATLMRNYETGYGIFWNKTLFQKYNLPDIDKLYAEGEWTWDKFKEVCLAGNQDLDSDGTIDIYGLAAGDAMEWNYLYSSGAEVATTGTDGLKINLSDPKIIEAMTAYQDFCSTVSFRSDINWDTEEWDVFNTGFRDGKFMMLMEATWISGSYLEVADGGMVDDWGWVPFPKGPSAEGVVCYNSGAGVFGMLYGIDNAEEKAQIYNLITDVAETPAEWDELVEAQLENWGRDQSSVQNAASVLNSVKMNPIYGFNGVLNAMRAMLGEVRSGAMTPNTAIEAYQSQIDSAIADIKTYDYNADMEAIKAEQDQKDSES